MKKQGSTQFEASLWVENGTYDIYVLDGQNKKDTGVDAYVNGNEYYAAIDYYTVSFVDEYNSLIDGIDSQIVLKGEKAVKPTTDPGRIGYTFAGWVLYENGSSSDDYYSFNTLVKKTTRLLATYTASGTSYKVEYYEQDVDGNYPSKPSDYATVSAKTDQVVTAITDYKDGFEPDTSRNESYTVKADASTVAKFYYKRKSYQLTWYLAGGTLNGSTPNQYQETVVYGKKITPPDVSKEGYTLTGWKLSDGSADYAKGVTMPAKNIAYKAQWGQITYTITYNLDGGSFTNGQPVTSYTASDRVNIYQTPTKAGYTFKGWTGSNGNTPQQYIYWDGETGNRVYTAVWEADATPTPSVPVETPTAAPTQTAAPVVEPTAAPVTKGEKLTVGSHTVSLGMTKTAVKAAMGDPVLTGTSPQNCESYVFNPEGKYSSLLEVQFKDDVVVEMSTISKNFSYGDIAKAGNSVSDLTGNGFAPKSTYKYTMYAKQADGAFVNVMTDKQRGKEAYGIQVFDKELGSLDSLLYPRNCTYNDAVNKFQGQLTSYYLNAYRVYHLGEDNEMTITNVGAAQTQSEYMASINKAQSTSKDGTTCQERFEEEYGSKVVLGDEYYSYGSADAFSAATYAIATCTSSSGFYKYILEEDYDMYLECGFAAGNVAADKTFSAFDLYGMGWL